MKQGLVSGSYLALIALQTVWHFLLPPPGGAGNWILALVATIPLLLPVKGVLSGSLRSMTWAGYLVMLYLIVGVVEAWANPSQRIPALLQVLIVILFVGSVLGFSRSSRQS